MPRTGRYTARGISRHTAFLICLAVITAAAVAAAVFLLFNKGEGDSPRPVAPTVEGFDAAAVPGSFRDEAAGTLNNTDVFDYRINAAITVVKGYANLRIENPVENRQLMKVTLTLDDGTMVYATDFIRPRYCIEEDRLDTSLKAGDYTANALIEVFDRVSREKAGEEIVPVRLSVQ